MKAIINILLQLCGGNGTYHEEWRATFSGDGNTFVYRGVRPHRRFGRAPLQVQAFAMGEWINENNTPRGFVTFVNTPKKVKTTQATL